jgi:hypothetical protein
LYYAPQDEEGDRHGGRVVIKDGPLLEGFRTGEFVEVQGSLIGEDLDENRLSPEYEIVRVESLER